MLSIALIGPDMQRRAAVYSSLSVNQSSGIREFTSYPPRHDDIAKMLEQHYDAVVVDLDSDPEYALELVENLCGQGVATVMVYSAQASPEMLVRCMRAGAREFLTMPLEQGAVAEALVRASARRTTVRSSKKTSGKLMVFMGAKGGAGVTTLACNFAVSLAQTTASDGQNTLLIDLDLPLGDAALNLGIVAEYSTVNALEAVERLDASFLSSLLVKHSSGVSVLAAPGRFPQFQPSYESINKLVTVARESFDNIVVDVGSRLDLTETALYREASTIYLVTQAGIPELRNSNRLISQFFSAGGPKLEVVLNRYDTRMMGVTEEHITKALTRPAQWRIPNDYASVRKMQINATPLALSDSPVARLVRQMARAAAGQDAEPEKKKGFSLFG
ncbi:MAG TPA: AAA family ATPase [Terracidiphilus sp.]|nr:AAA family ATPase [Terracidiphilus sp.]